MAINKSLIMTGLLFGGLALAIYGHANNNTMFRSAGVAAALAGAVIPVAPSYNF